MYRFKQILEKRKEYFVGKGENSESVIRYMNEDAKGCLEELTKIIYEDGYLEYVEDIVKIKELYGKLLVLAKSYKMQGTDNFEHEEILKTIVDGINLFHTHYYNKEKREHTNWWQWEIGIPLIIENIFSILYEEIDEEIIKENLEVTRYFQPDPKYSGNNPVAMHPSNNPLRLSSGGNRADTAKISFLRGALLSDKKEIRAALEALEDTWKYIDNTDETDGFYMDGSFIQHGSIPYAGGYGEVLLTGLGEIFFLAQGSKFLKYIKNSDRLYEIIRKSFFPFFFNGRFSDMLAGRGITRENNDDGVIGHRILNDILLISGVFDKLKRNKIQNFIKNEIVKYGEDKYLEEEKSSFMYREVKKLLAIEFEDDEDYYAPTVVVCNRMNRVVKRTKNYSIGIAMHSRNVGNYEAMNGENLNGWYTGDGAYYLYDDHREADKDYWRNVDMYYIPGTTETKMNMIGVNAQRNIETSFIDNEIVGGVGQGEYGLAYMKFINWNETLTSRKSWCFLRGRVVFIEDKIKSEKDVYSAIFNRKFSECPNILIDGKEFTEDVTSGEIKDIVVDDWEIRFIESGEINVEVEKRGKYYFVKIWQSYPKEQEEKKIIWELNSLKEENREEYELEFKENGYIIEAENMQLELDWAEKTIAKMRKK